jgi:hypothetical protein
MTPIGSRLYISLNDEYLRMQNDWFFKWHSIGGERAVEIDSFLGKPIVYGGIKFDGTARLVYWVTIQRYLNKKIGSIFDSLEEELRKYPLEVKAKALTEAQWIVGQFSGKIQRAAIEKDRILRGNGIEFPPEYDAGHWQGCGTGDIQARRGIASNLLRSGTRRRSGHCQAQRCGNTQTHLHGDGYRPAKSMELGTQ